MPKPSPTSQNTLKYCTADNGGKRRSGIFHQLPLSKNFKRNKWTRRHRLASEFDSLCHLSSSAVSTWTTLPTTNSSDRYTWPHCGHLGNSVEKLCPRWMKDVFPCFRGTLHLQHISRVVADACWDIRFFTSGTRPRLRRYPTMFIRCEYTLCRTNASFSTAYVTQYVMMPICKCPV